MCHHLLSVLYVKRTPCSAATLTLHCLLQQQQLTSTELRQRKKESSTHQQLPLGHYQPSSSSLAEKCPACCHGTLDIAALRSSLHVVWLKVPGVKQPPGFKERYRKPFSANIAVSNRESRIILSPRQSLRSRILINFPDTHFKVKGLTNRQQRIHPNIHTQENQSQT